METVAVEAGSDSRLSGADLWPRLRAFDLFKQLNDEQRESFLNAYRREAGMRIRRFAPGETICRQGEYELDLCFILDGAVDLYDDVAGKRRVKIFTMPAGAFYGELGALIHSPAAFDVDIVA